MKQIIFVLLGILILAACEKRKEEIKSGFLAGRLLYTNPYEPLSGTKGVPGKLVRIAAAPSDTLNYIYSVTTDQEGYFTFQYLDANKPYLVFFEDSIGGLLYKGQTPGTTDNAGLRIVAVPDTKGQNGYSLKVTDTTGGRVAGASICVFNNMAGWNADTCIGSLYGFDVSAEGDAVKYKITPGLYYFLGTAVIGGVYYRGKASVEVKASGIAPVTLELRPVTATGFELTLTDAYHTPVSNAQICVFRNYTLFAADTCLGNVFELTTDRDGIAKKYDITPGRYYLRNSLQIGDIKLHGLDSVDVVKDNIKKKTLELK